MPTTPPGACDAHIHIYDPRFAPHPGRSLLPGTTAADYIAQVRTPLHLQRTVVVTPTVYVTDNSVTLDAIAQLGLANARGVAVLHPDVSDATLDRLHAGGIRGIRFTLFDPATAVTTAEMMAPLAARVRRLGWHLQLHLRADQIVALAPVIEALPCALVFDHMARLVQADGGIAQEAWGIVRRLLARGNTWVKLSAPYLDARGPYYEASNATVHALIDAAPDRLVWGSDWPHPTEKTTRPDDHNLFAQLTRWVPDAPLRQRILVDNPARLYGFDTP